MFDSLTHIFFKLVAQRQPNCNMILFRNWILVLLEQGDVLHFVRFHIGSQSKKGQRPVQRNQISDSALIFMQLVRGNQALALVVWGIHRRLVSKRNALVRNLGRPNVDQALGIARDQVLAINRETKRSYFLFVLQCPLLFVPNYVVSLKLVVLRLDFKGIAINILVVASGVHVGLCKVDHHFKDRALGCYSLNAYLLGEIVNFDLLVS